MRELMPVAEKVAAKLFEAKQTIAIAKSSTGGLVSAALLAVPGASRYFMGGAVVYTRHARRLLLDLEGLAPGLRSSTEPYVLIHANRIRERFETTWGLGGSRRGRAGQRAGAWQHLWRCRRPQLLCGCRRHAARQGRGLDDARDRQGRPLRQHVLVREGRAGVFAEAAVKTASLLILRSGEAASRRMRPPRRASWFETPVFALRATPGSSP